MTGIPCRKEIKSRSSKLLREEFPHLKEWCGDIYVHNFPLEEEYERERYHPWHNQKGLRPFMTYRGRATSPCFDKPFLKVFKRRRSVRHFNREKIPDECMEQILEVGRWAPSGANAQPWRFVVVTRKETLATIAERCYYKAFRSRHVGEAGAVVVICSDPEAGSQTYPLDAAIAGTNMTLMATSLGIGSCWIGAFEEQTLKNMLHIPEKLKIIALISFGYEIGKASTPPRLPLSSIVHYETYDAENEPNIITKKKSSGPFSVFGKLLRVLFNKR